MYFTPEQSGLILKEYENIMVLNEPDDMKVLRMWGNLVMLRATMLAHTVRQNVGNEVHMGPFKGMQLTQDVMWRAYAPLLLGTYEHELHATFERVIASPVQTIINIGCSVGYYAVGLARRMPQATVHAFDIDEAARKKCADMVALNGVQDRVTIHGEFRGEDFESYRDKSPLIVMDIEGAETGLLDPALYPALKTMPVIVELHDLMDPAISGTIRDRFAATHDIEIIHNQPLFADIKFGNNPNAYVDPFDRLILTWELRDGPTPWAVMWPKKA